MHGGEMPQIRNLYMRDRHTAPTTLAVTGVSNWETARLLHVE